LNLVIAVYHIFQHFSLDISRLPYSSWEEKNREV